MPLDGRFNLKFIYKNNLGVVYVRNSETLG